MYGISKRVLAAVAAIGLAAPAQAEDEATMVIAGLLGVVILGAIISNLDDGDPAPLPVVAPQSHSHGTIVPLPAPGHVQRYDLPSQCVFGGRNSRGENKLVGASCLNRHFQYANELPQTCRSRYWSKKRSEHVSGYGLSCLENNGYRVAWH